MSDSSNAREKSWAGRFFFIWTGQTLSLFGSSIVSFALVWWLTVESNSATVLATATLVGMLPGIFLSPFVGPLIDRFSRRAIMIISDSFIALVNLALMILFWLEIATVWHLYIVIFLGGLGGVFHRPAMTASTSLLVPEKHLTRVAAMNETMGGAVQIAAPILGAILIMLLPMKWILSIDVFSAILAVAPLFFVKIPSPKKSMEKGIAKSYWKDLGEGLKYILTQPAILAISIMAMFINFVLVPSFSIFPLVVKNLFGKGALELSWVEMAMGFGLIGGGVLLSVWGGFKKKTNTMFLGLMGIGIAILSFSAVPSSMFFLVPIATFTIGAMLVFANSPITALKQALIPHEYQGRVFSLTGAAGSAMGPVGLLIAGPLSDWLGLRSWYLIAGLVTILATLISYAQGNIRKLEADS